MDDNRKSFITFSEEKESELTKCGGEDEHSPPWIFRVPIPSLTNVNGPFVDAVPVNEEEVVSIRLTPRALKKLRLPPGNRPLHITDRLSLLCEDICLRVEEFQHIDMSRILITFIESRNSQRHGLQARLTPLRFPGGAMTALRNGHRYRIQRFFTGAVECKYVLSFSMPRFLNQTFTEKLITVFHELFHIDPEFQGELRGHGHSKCVHGGDQRRYDREMLEYCRRYLALGPSAELLDFLRLSARELASHYPSIVGINVPTPKLIPVLNR